MMNKLQKDAIYDELCRVLLEFEEDAAGHMPAYVEPLYEMLVKVLNNWEELTTKE